MQYIYLITCQGFKKIGIAGDVVSRLASLQTGNPFPLRVDGCYGFDNAEVVEKSIHQRFEQFRERGEWFDLSKDDVGEFHKICVILGGHLTVVTSILGKDAVDEADAIQETQEILLGGITWRLEKRNDRTPPGYAIFRRGGDKKYLGYIGMRNLIDPEHPTVEEIESVIAKHKDGVGE